MKNTAKKEKVNIRVTVDEKNKISKAAEKMNMSLSDYARMILLSPSKKITKGDVAKSNFLVKCQEIINYIEDEYDMNGELERRIEELWEIS